MPIVFCPPSVSAVKTRTARYFSGSRAALIGVGSTEGLAVAIAGDVLALDDGFVLVSDRWHAPNTSDSEQAAKRKINCFVFETFDSGRNARPVLQTAVFIRFSEEFERRGSVMKRGLFEGIVG
jgi:hypothetical protein